MPLSCARCENRKRWPFLQVCQEIPTLHMFMGLVRCRCRRDRRGRLPRSAVAETVTSLLGHDVTHVTSHAQSAETNCVHVSEKENQQTWSPVVVPGSGQGDRPPPLLCRRYQLQKMFTQNQTKISACDANKVNTGKILSESQAPSPLRTHRQGRIVRNFTFCGGFGDVPASRPSPLIMFLVGRIRLQVRHRGR